MSVFTKKQITIDPDDHELIKLISKQKKELAKEKAKTQNVSESSGLNGDHLEKQKKDYRPRRMSDSFTLQHAGTLQNESNQEPETSLHEYLETEILQETTPIEQERPLDMPFQFKTVISAPVIEENTKLTSELDQEELMDYMHKHHRVNRLMVTIIVAVIIIFAIIMIVILLMNLKKSGQSSPLGGL